MDDIRDHDKAAEAGNAGGCDPAAPRDEDTLIFSELGDERVASHRGEEEGASNCGALEGGESEIATHFGVGGKEVGKGLYDGEDDATGAGCGAGDDRR